MNPSIDFSRQQLAAHFHSMARINRDELFGADVEKCRPINLPLDTETMFAGYVGKRFEPGGGTLFLAINPGGGGDAYVSRTASDEKFYPLLIDFKKADLRDTLEGFERINAAFQSIVTTWNLWRILGPAVEASGCDVSEVAYLNLVPYRTQNDKMPPAYA